MTDRMKRGSPRRRAVHEPTIEERVKRLEIREVTTFQVGEKLFPTLQAAQRHAAKSFFAELVYEFTYEGEFDIEGFIKHLEENHQAREVLIEFLQSVGDEG